MTREKQKKPLACDKRSRDSVYARDNERKAHKEKRRRTEGVNEKERAMEGCC